MSLEKAVKTMFQTSQLSLEGEPAREANIEITHSTVEQPIFGQWPDLGEDYSMMDAMWVQEILREGLQSFRSSLVRFRSCAADRGGREWKPLVS